ncbi:MAG: Gx transporter family protein [Vulcanimicrobiota bacterium]
MINYNNSAQAAAKPKKYVLLSLFVAVSSILQIVESYIIPTSLPFRIGIANIIVILVIVLFGAREAVMVAVVRSTLASLVTGRFMNIPFWLSLSGGIISTLVMGYLYYNVKQISIIGISVVGATLHNFTQLGVIYFLLSKNSGVLNLLPALWLSALISGILIGIIAVVLLKIPVLNEVFNGKAKENRAEVNKNDE